MTTIDQWHRLLKLLGWSIGDVAFQDLDTGEVIWLVVGTRGGHTISAQGRPQSEAWAWACRLTGQAGTRG